MATKFLSFRGLVTLSAISALAVLTSSVINIDEAYAGDGTQCPVFTSEMVDVIGSSVPRPSIVTAPKYTETSALFVKSVYSVLTGDEDAQTALSELEFELEKLLHFDVGVP